MTVTMLLVITGFAFAGFLAWAQQPARAVSAEATFRRKRRPF